MITALLNFMPIPETQNTVFRADFGKQTLYYTPGYLTGIDGELASTFEQAIKTGGSLGVVHLEQLKTNLLQSAKAAQNAWERLFSSPFTPLCLTLCPGNNCNLRCVYCYAKPSASSKKEAPLPLDLVESASVVVARNCSEAKQPFVVVFHGGGEPTLHFRWLEQALIIAENAAKKFHVPVFRYIATNGVMPKEKAVWLAKHFDLIGLSCDGPEEIQSVQRPFRNRRSSTSHWVEETARIFHLFQKPFHVRTTITAATLHRQAEIAAYVCERIHPQEIHVEPVYGKENVGSHFRLDSEQAEEFVNKFIEAETLAHNSGVRWQMSGSRLNEIHGPYCHILKSVMLLAVPRRIPLCFQYTNFSVAQQDYLDIGMYLDGQIVFQSEKIFQGLQVLKSRSDFFCSSCFNRFHCVRSCPDACLLLSDPLEPPEKSFRCRVQSLLARIKLQEIAKQHRGLSAWGAFVPKT